MKSTLTIKKNYEAIIKGLMKAFLFLSTLFVLWLFVANNAYAAADPITGINNLKNLIASFFEAIGGIAAFIGLAILVMGLMTHDPSQKVQGAIAMGCGILLAFATWVIDYVINK